jgi:D-glycero-D-manno-heptose 1,7-bisphosphate phosphatase
MNRMLPAIFLDRDGVIIENRPDYVRAWKDVTLYPQALSALARVATSGYKIVMVTNQSAVGRGLITLETALDINQRLISSIEHAGGRIDAAFLCPHSPEDECDCRKPKPGLILQAAEQLSLDLARSIMIGDAQTDLVAGEQAGVGKLALVLTGRGKAQSALVDPTKFSRPVFIFDTLSHAIDQLIPAA